MPMARAETYGRRMLGSAMKSTRSEFCRRVRPYAIPSLLLGALALGVFESNTAYVRDWLAVSLYGSAPHRVPCENRPTAEEAQRTLDRHTEMLEKIEAVDGVEWYLSTRRCRGGSAVRRAELIIEHPASKQRDAVRAIIGDERFFFGVPYGLVNY